MLKEKRNKKNEWLCYLTHERSYCAIKRLIRKKLIRAFFWEGELSNYSCLLILSDAKEITVIVFPRLQTPTHPLSLSLSLSHQLSQMYTHVRMHKHTHKLQHSHTHTQTRTKSSLQTISEMVYLLCVTSKSDQTLFPFPQPSILQSNVAWVETSSFMSEATYYAFSYVLLAFVQQMTTT